LCRPAYAARILKGEEALLPEARITYADVGLWNETTEEAPDNSEARTVLPLNSKYFVLFWEFSRRHLAPSNAVLVASPGP
jgi:hypothetical protein